MIATINFHVCLNRNGYTNNCGTRQVVVELYQQGQRRTINTHVHVATADFAHGRVQPSNPDHDLLNRRIRRIVRRLMELEDEMLDSGISPTPTAVAEAYLHHQTRTATISEWANAVIDPSNRRTTTKDAYQTLCNSIELFHPGLRLGELSHDVIMRWQHWMRTERHLCDNTIALRLKTLRCLVNEAIKRNVIRNDNDPFRHIRIPEIQARREHLTEQELAALEHLPLANARLCHVRDAFLFCCYTGLRWGDFRRLTAANIVAATAPSAATTLVLRQHKTSHALTLPLNILFAGKPLALLRRYPSPEQFAAIGDNRHCNTDLRQIAQQAGLQKHLHWHLARHTCGTLLNQRGLRMQEIQFILGHQRQSTTERHYAETTLQQVQRSLAAAFP
ncbi:MAG: site-specific integrase [Prevotella sp.]|nr:site-specific integrase [Prevotella sp.]